jgi:hypothetical protein
MAIPARHAGAPYANAETLQGPDLETDFANIYAEVSGNLDNSNIASAANIAGTKLLDNSITSAKLVDDSVTIAKLADSAVGTYRLVTATASFAMSSGSGSWHDVDSITNQTLTPGQTGDLLLLHFQANIVHTGAGQSRVSIRFTIGGSNTTGLGTKTFTGESSSIEAIWAVATTSTAGLTIKPQYENVITSGSSSMSARLFLARIIPIKA